LSAGPATPLPRIAIRIGGLSAGQGTGPSVSIWCSHRRLALPLRPSAHARWHEARACMPRHACTRPDAAGEAWRPAARPRPGRRRCWLGSRQGMQMQRSFLRWVWGSTHVCSTVFVKVRAGLFWRFCGGGLPDHGMAASAWHDCRCTGSRVDGNFTYIPTTNLAEATLFPYSCKLKPQRFKETYLAETIIFMKTYVNHKKKDV